MYFYQIQTQYITKGSLSKRKNKITSQKNKMGGEVKKKDYFEIYRTTFQVISVGGCENMKKYRNLQIHLPCACLLGLDKVVNCKDKTVCNVKTRFISNILEKEKSLEVK